MCETCAEHSEARACVFSEALWPKWGNVFRCWHYSCGCGVPCEFLECISVPSFSSCALVQYSQEKPNVTPLAIPAKVSPKLTPVVEAEVPVVTSPEEPTEVAETEVSETPVTETEVQPPSEEVASVETQSMSLFIKCLLCFLQTRMIVDEPLTAAYVIVGGGTAAYFAVRGIRDKDPKAKVSHCSISSSNLFSYL